MYTQQKKKHHISRFASHLIDQWKIATGSGRWIDFKNFVAIENKDDPTANPIDRAKHFCNRCVFAKQIFYEKMQPNHNSQRNCIIATPLFLGFQCRDLPFLWCEISCPQCAIKNFYSAQWTIAIDEYSTVFYSLFFIIHLKAPSLAAPVDRSPFGSIVMFWRAQVFFVKMPFQVATCNFGLRKCYSFVLFVFHILCASILHSHLLLGQLNGIDFVLVAKKIDDKAKSIVVPSYVRQDWKCNHFNATA